MFKKLIFGLCLWLFATTLIFGANFDDGYSAIEKGDYKTAFTIFEDLAKKGDIEAQLNLGYMYHYGKGVSLDYKKAIELYEKAATQGYAMAQNNLGVMYRDGEGVKQDYKKAI
ncbi:tetratricopeptide repeat protein, partial [Aliarcobacter skirrowii]|uniref:tetratricopeptide repeat protein n=1 Tax=Aliarcobacter skirrowii TaxID=28200 RepID=UPI000B0549E2